MGDLVRFKNANDSPEGLTRIHTRIHCVATPDPLESDDELERIATQNFLSTLAHVALTVAKREAEAEQVDP